MDITLVLNEMIMMLLMLCVGVVGAKTGVVDTETNHRLSGFAMAIPQCAIILSSAMNLEQKMTPGEILGILAVGCAMYAIMLAFCAAVPRLVRMERRDWGVYSFLGAFGNVGFMGYPIVRSLFGNDAMFCAVLLAVPFNLLAFTVGVKMIGGADEGHFSWRMLLSPPLVASVVSVVMIFMPISWPAPVVEAVDYLGNMIVPLSMIIIGASLGSQDLRQAFGNWRAYAFAPVKLLAVPVLLRVVMGPFIRDPVLLRVVTLEGAMPSATVAVMLSIQYGANEKLASQVVFISTVLSVATIPFVCWLLL